MPALGRAHAGSRVFIVQWHDRGAKGSVESRLALGKRRVFSMTGVRFGWRDIRSGLWPLKPPQSRRPNGLVWPTRFNHWKSWTRPMGVCQWGGKASTLGS